MRRHGLHRNASGATFALARASLVLTFASIALALGPGATVASATSMVIGETAPMSPLAYCSTESGKPAELLTSYTEGGNAFAAPVAGTITSWSTTAAFAQGQLVGMKIYRPVPGTEQSIPGVTLPPGIMDTYTVLAHDGPRALKPGVLNTFDTNIPIQAGDIVGYYSANGSKATPNACWFNNLVASDYLAINETSTSDGVSVYLPTLARAARPNVSATLQPRPTIRALSPTSGPVLGGTPVVITGTDLENATSVSFGASPASFTAVSETEIVATTPPGAGAGAVEVTVRTGAGSATSAFVYEVGASPASQAGGRHSCVVPKLKGRALRAVRRKLSRAHCQLGAIRGAKGKRASKVASQRPAGGRVLAAGAKVSVVLSLPPR